ncbi:hypothetical protein U9M48_001343 [Paspalum notatum var. saurae]|uniref:Uncharacterized protein n=1 Tax=Paspalum notatum var. saurae TaxID=547442 RepID=A0AAQ3PI08_PASNO
MVKVVLSSIPVYLMLTKWVTMAIDKRRRDFLWKGQEHANGGNLNLELFGWALRIRWMWLQKNDSSRPWAGLPIQVPHNAKAMFEVVIVTTIGDGETTNL